MNISINLSGFAQRSRWWLERGFLLLGVGFCIFQLLLSWNAPISEQYAFRQTQTAFSVLWLLNGSGWFDYQTPVFGAPWSVPFEFPLYQWLVVLAKQVFSSLTLDQAGRIVSLTFMLACLWPLRRLASHLQNGLSLFYVIGALFLLSPIYAFWARSFMIESTALFFSIWFVAALADYLAGEQSGFGFAELMVAAILGALIKVTTFVGFSLAGLIVLSVYALNALQQGKVRVAVKAVISVGVSVLVSLIVLWLWVRYGDSLKSANQLAAMFTGKSLGKWNFGTLAQRTSFDLLHVLAVRGPNEAFGTWLVPLLVFLWAAIKLTRAKIIVCLALLGLYLAPFYVFTNLHLVHHYYQLANSVFLVAAVGYAMVSLDEVMPGLLCPLLIAAAVAGLYGYQKYYFDDELLGSREHELALASQLRQSIPRNEVFIGFGLQWSSEVPYYAGRRAILVPDRTTPLKLRDVRDHLTTYLGGYPLAGVVVCPNELAANEAKKDDYQALLTKVIGNRTPEVVGYCVIYR